MHQDKVYRELSEQYSHYIELTEQYSDYIELNSTHSAASRQSLQRIK